MSRESPKWGVVERVRNGDPSALAELFRRHAHAVHRIAFRITGSAHDADDVLQDVFLGLPEALRAYEETGNLDGWLKTLAVRRSLMALRKEKHRREVPLGKISHSIAPAGESLEPVVDRVALERALSDLPDQLRVVFVLKEIEGYNHDEIGDMLGIGNSASTAKLHRARKVLREKLWSIA